MDAVLEDLFDLLGRRGRMLTALAAESKTKPELVKAVGVSRSTVDRAVRELEAADLVRRHGGTVALTTRGGLMLDLTEYVSDVAATIEEFDDELDAIPVRDRPHFAQFADATVVIGSDAAPHRPVSLLARQLTDVDSVRAVTLSVIPTLVEEVRHRVLDGTLDVEMVLSDAVLSQLVSSHGDALEETVDKPTVSLYRTDIDLPYGVSVLETADGPKAVLVLQGDGGITALVQSYDRKAVEWANGIIDRERARADPV